MEQTDNNLGHILGEIGCRFRGNIESHVMDYDLIKEDDVEWLLEPLDLIKHPDDLVLDAFKKGDSCGWLYELYFHKRGATTVYVPYDQPITWPPIFFKREGNTIHFLEADEIELPPEPKPYDKSMLVKGLASCPVIAAVPKIWDEVSIPFNELGIWQSLLLRETFIFFPKGWHGNYYNAMYVFSRADMQQIIDSCKSKYYDFTDAEFERLEAYYRFLDFNPATVSKMFKFRKADYERLASYIDCEDIIPSVEINGDKAIVTYCYWNDWEGFCKRIITVERHNQSVVFSKTEKEVLVEYDCGITY